ncbi:MAG: hypothetical protein L0H64_13880 [Pseudonocardia sp.]|nr:hypothetical protein [Pseudonocardia sp.]
MSDRMPQGPMPPYPRPESGRGGDSAGESGGADGSGGGGSQGGPVPPGVRIAYELWCVVALLGVVATVGVILVMSSMQDTLVDELMDRFADGVGGQPLTRADAVSGFHVTLGIFGVIGAVLVALVVLFARKLLRGRGWARAVLLGITAILVVVGFEGLLGYDGSGAGAIVLEIASILQAVLAVGASVVAHRGEANRYFVGKPKR